MSIDTSYEDYFRDSFSNFERYDLSTATWRGKTVCQEISQDISTALTATIRNAHAYIQARADKIQPMGEGGYNVEIEKDLDGTTTVSGNISYETDKGVKVEAEGKIDSEGNSSASVRVGGKF